jgi:hypothetical protein
MRLPKQVKPVMRKVSAAGFNSGITPSDLASCQRRCNRLYEPGRGLCKSLCEDL